MTAPSTIYRTVRSGSGVKGRKGQRGLFSLQYSLFIGEKNHISLSSSEISPYRVSAVLAFMPNLRPISDKKNYRTDFIQSSFIPDLEKEPTILEYTNSCVIPEQKQCSLSKESRRMVLFLSNQEVNGLSQE